MGYLGHLAIWISDLLQICGWPFLLSRPIYPHVSPVASPGGNR